MEGAFGFAARYRSACAISGNACLSVPAERSGLARPCFAWEPSRHQRRRRHVAVIIFPLSSAASLSHLSPLVFHFGRTGAAESVRAQVSKGHGPQRPQAPEQLKPSPEIQGLGFRINPQTLTHKPTSSPAQPRKGPRQLPPHPTNPDPTRVHVHAHLQLEHQRPTCRAASAAEERVRACVCVYVDAYPCVCTGCMRACAREDASPPQHQVHKTRTVALTRLPVFRSALRAVGWRARAVAEPGPRNMPYRLKLHELRSFFASSKPGGGGVLKGHFAMQEPLMHESCHH